MPGSLSRAAVFHRLDRVLRGPRSSRSSPAGGFEAALLQAWSAEAPNHLRWVREHLTEDQLRTITDTRSRATTVSRLDDVQGFLLEVFHALPNPVLLRTREGMLWNRQFATHYHREQEHGVDGADAPPMPRFIRLLEHAQDLAARRMLVPLGRRAWRARLLPLPDAQGAAVYLTGLDVQLPMAPTQVCEILLFKACGWTHKEIGILFGRSKSYVDHLSAGYRQELSVLRSALCRVADL